MVPKYDNGSEDETDSPGMIRKRHGGPWTHIRLILKSAVIFPGIRKTVRTRNMLGSDWQIRTLRGFVNPLRTRRDELGGMNLNCLLPVRFGLSLDSDSQIRSMRAGFANPSESCLWTDCVFRSTGKHTYKSSRTGFTSGTTAYWKRSCRRGIFGAIPFTHAIPVVACV